MGILDSQTNVNARVRLTFSGSTEYVNESFITKSVEDNFYISHPIPASDHQYRWISSSLISDDRVLFPYGYATSSTDLNLITGGSLYGNGVAATPFWSQLISGEILLEETEGTVAPIILPAQYTDAEMTSYAAATSHNINHHDKVNEGDLFLVFINFENLVNVTLPDDTWIVIEETEATGIDTGLYAKRLNGTEGNTSETFILDSSMLIHAITFRIAAGTWYDNGNLADAITVGTDSQTTGTNPNPPSVTTDWTGAANLFIAMSYADGNESYSGFPSGYTGDYIQGTLGTAYAHKTATADTDDAGTFTKSGSSAYRTLTYVVRPHPGSANSYYEVDSDTRLVEPVINENTFNPRVIRSYFSRMRADNVGSGIAFGRTEHAVARELKRNNKLFIHDAPRVRQFRNNSNKVYVSGEKRNVNGTEYEEPLISIKYHPLIHKLSTSTNQKGFYAPTRIKYTHANELGYFANKPINDKINVETNIYGIYDSFTKFYLGEEPELETVGKFISIKYEETVWPKESTAFLEKARRRINFDFNWRKDRGDRTEYSASNSQGHAIPTSSMWPLDARPGPYSTETLFTTASTNNGGNVGELASVTSIYHNGTVSRLTASALFTMPMPDSSSAGVFFTNDTVFNLCSASFDTSLGELFFSLGFATLGVTGSLV